MKGGNKFVPQYKLCSLFYFRFGNYTSIEILIDASKSETNDADSDGRTPLMLSCLNGHFKATQSLLALGADNSVR